MNRQLACGLHVAGTLCCLQPPWDRRSRSAPGPPPSSSVERPGWRLVWHDEFDTAVGPDWTFDIGTGTNGWGNREHQYYGTAGERARGGWSADHRGEEGAVRVSESTSARLKTEGKKTFKYGRIEARIQVPRGQGLWPAFWALGEDQKAVGWPRCGEIDIMENIGKEPNRVHATVHGPGYSGGSGVGGFWDLPSGAFADGFHVFAVEWDASGLRFFVDDTVYKSIAPADVPGTWVFGHPFFLLLNLAVGGNWPGAPDASTMFPAQMKVDYVRVYERAGGRD